MNIRQAKSALIAAIQAGLPILFLGGPGVGKSTVPREVASEYFGGSWKTNMIELRSSTADASEISDLKAIINGKVYNAPQDWVPTDESVKEGRHPERGIVFLDEILDGPMMVQSGFQQFVLDRKLGSVDLASGWYIMGASNRRNDGAAAGRLSTALASRFIIVEVEHDIESTMAYAYSKNWHPLVPAFLRFRPNLLTTFDDAKKNGKYSYACGRTWEMLSKLLYQSLDPSIRLEVFSGVIGDGAAAEFIAFENIYKSLPDIDLIRNNPATAAIPTEPSVLYATLGSLIGELSMRVFDILWPYIDRLPPEFATLFVRDAVVKLGTGISSTKAWENYVVKYGSFAY